VKNKNARCYRRKVLALLPCTKRQKQRIISQFDASLSGYIQSNPDANFIDLEEHFGSPEAIAASYVESAGTAELLRSLYIRKRIVLAVSLALAVLIISWAAIVSWSMVKFNNAVNGYSIESTRTLPDDTVINNGEDTVTYQK